MGRARFEHTLIHAAAVRVCAALAALTLTAASPAAAMTFEFTTAGAGCEAQLCLLAKGPIDEDSAHQLKTLAREKAVRPGAVVILDSPGGATLAGVALGGQIRNLGLATRIERVGDQSSGVCASACAYAFLGGVRRDVAEGAKLGVHQMASSPDGPYLSASDAQWAAAMIALHVDRMGTDISFLTKALRTPPHRLYWFSREELASAHIVTGEAEAGLSQIALERQPKRPDTSVSFSQRK